MKTPREILLAQHRAAGPQLDSIRRATVAELKHKDTKAQSGLADLVSWCLGGSRVLWQELILPNRRVWAGLAATWLLIAAVNVSQHEPSTVVLAKSSANAEMMSFRDQQKLLNELLADRSVPADADRPRTFSPKPRTETAEVVAV